jgi:hypothetical protein
MAHKQTAVQRLYGKLLRLYPRAFRERLGESMQQTFDDLYHERQRQAVSGVFGFVLWLFLETAISIFRERLLHMTQGGFMQTVMKTHGPSVFLSFLLILPFLIMQVVNRRTLQEEFPVMLFFGMWLTLFAICLILLPIVRVRWAGNPELASSMPAQRNRLFTSPKSVALISMVLLLSPVILFGLNALGWTPLNRLLNGPNPEVPYLPGQIIGLSLIVLPIAAGIVAGGPIVRTLRGGGSLFAHPLHLLIVVLIASFLAFGLVTLIIDQWPCFMGVPNCD